MTTMHIRKAGFYGAMGPRRRFVTVQIDTYEDNTWEKSMKAHVIIMPPWPFDIPILCPGLLVFTLNMIYRTCLLWHSVLLHHGRLWAENLTCQYKIVTSFERSLNHCGTTVNITSWEDRIYIARGRKVFSDNGMIIYGLMESSKGYSISKSSVTFSQGWRPAYCFQRCSLHK